MDLYQLNALEIIKLLKSKEISPLDCLSSLQKRISSVNKKVNALVTLCFERAEVNAKILIERDIKNRGVLQVLPIPIKDVKDVDLDLVWDPPWDKSMMSEAAKLELNL